MGGGEWGEGGGVPFIFQLVAEFKDLDFHLALAVVLEQALVRRARAVGLVQVVGAPRVRGGRVARALEGEVALHVAGGAAAAGGGEADVVGHCGCGGGLGGRLGGRVVARVVVGAMGGGR